MDVMLELASEDEKKVISWALAVTLIATMLAAFERMHRGPEAQDAYLDPARELLETREQLGHIIEG